MQNNVIIKYNEYIIDITKLICFIMILLSIFEHEVTNENSI